MPEKPMYAVGLDAGSTKTRMVVCALEDRLRLLGCAVVESQGWSKGSIADQRAVGESILAALAGSGIERGRFGGVGGGGDGRPQLARREPGAACWNWVTRARFSSAM